MDIMTIAELNESYKDMSWSQDEGLEIVRPDGFKLVHCSAGGWDIHSPTNQIFAWVLEMDEAEAKISREQRERFWH